MINIRTIEVSGLASALTALRLPHNGTPKSGITRTSRIVSNNYDDTAYSHLSVENTIINLHKKDLSLLQNLIKSGDHHAKVMRGVLAYAEIDAPIYFWVDLEQHGIGHQRLCSASTMHTECKGLYGEELQKVKGEIKFGRMVKKVDFFSYQCLRNIVRMRHNHRLPEFHEFIEWIRTLPLAEELIFHGINYNNGDPDLPK